MSDLIDIIERALKRKGVSAAYASEKVAGHNALIRNIKRGNKPSFDKVERLFEYLGINLTYSLDEDDLPAANKKVPLLGFIAAGGDDYPDDTSVTYVPDNGSTDEAVLPPGTFMRMRGALFCLEVKGKSMLPVYADGDLLFAYKDDPVRGDHDRIVGLNCAITLESGEIYVKRLARPDSGIRGEWNLESLNPRWPVMRNQRLIEALPIRHVTHKV